MVPMSANPECITDSCSGSPRYLLLRSICLEKSHGYFGIALLDGERKGQRPV